MICHHHYLRSRTTRRISSHRIPGTHVRWKQLLFVTALVCSASSAMAGPTYTFDVSEGLQPANVGNITLTQDGADSVNVSVDLLSGYGFINSGGPHTPFTFNLSGTGALSLDFTTPPNGTYASGVFSLDPAGGANTPYGTFGVALDSSAGNGTSDAYFGDLVFTLTRTGGLDTNDFVPNDAGSYFAADLTNGSNTGAQAWAIRNDPPPVTGVPEPGTMGLFGAGLIGVAAARRRRQARRLERV